MFLVNYFLITLKCKVLSSKPKELQDIYVKYSGFFSDLISGYETELLMC